MLDIAIDYGRSCGGIVPGAVTFAQDLMRDDPATFKRGYSFDSALLTACEAFDVTDPATRQEIRDRLGDRLTAQDA